MSRGCWEVFEWLFDETDGKPRGLASTLRAQSEQAIVLSEPMQHRGLSGVTTCNALPRASWLSQDMVSSNGCATAAHTDAPGVLHWQEDCRVAGWVGWDKEGGEWGGASTGKGCRQQERNHYGWLQLCESPVPFPGLGPPLLVHSELCQPRTGAGLSRHTGEEEAYPKIREQICPYLEAPPPHSL